MNAMRHKLLPEQREEIVEKLARGKTLKDLGIEYGVSASTVSRYLKRYAIDMKYLQPVRGSALDDSTKLELRKVLLGFNVENPNLLIAKLGEKFEIKIKYKEEYVIIHV